MNSTLVEILQSTNNPLIHNLNDNNLLTKYVNRLEFLLWGDTKRYKGPLADGFQQFEWISISLLISDWLVETIVDAKNTTTQIIIDEIRQNPQEIASFTLEFLTKLIERDIIKIDSEHKQKILLFLQNEMVVNAVLTHADDLLVIMEKIITATCNFCKRKNKIKQISERDGLKAYNANRALTKK